MRKLHNPLPGSSWVQIQLSVRWWDGARSQVCSLCVELSQSAHLGLFRLFIHLPEFYSVCKHRVLYKRGVGSKIHHEMTSVSLAAITYFNTLKYALVFTMAKHTFLDFCEFRNNVELCSLTQESKRNIN